MEASGKTDRPNCKLLISLPTLMFSVISFVFVLQRSAAVNPRNIAEVLVAATRRRLHHSRNEGLGY
jgi:hypothetical protein